MRKSLIFLGVLGAVLTLSWVYVAATDTATRDLSVQQTAVHNLSAPAPGGSKPLSVVAWVDQEDNTYAIGEQVQLFVQTTKDAYVTVMNVGPTGNTTVLFPNAMTNSNFVPANTPVQVPGPGSAITVQGPVGAELIKVIASTQPVNVFQSGQMTQAGAFRSVNAPVESWTRDLSVTMSSPSPQQTSAQAPQPQQATGGQVVSMPAGLEWDDYNKVIHTVAGAAGVGQGSVTTTPAWSHQAAVGAPFNLRVATEKASYRIGEPIQVMITTDRTCHLVVANITSSGETRLLYPNGDQPNSLVQGGQTIVVPGNVSTPRLVALGPPGEERLVTSCSETPPPQPLPIAQGAYPFVGQTVLASVGAATRGLSILTSPSSQGSGATQVGGSTGNNAVAVLPLTIQ